MFLFVTHADKPLGFLYIYLIFYAHVAIFPPKRIIFYKFISTFFIEGHIKLHGYTTTLKIHYAGFRRLR